MDATTNVKLKPGLKLLTPAMFVGIGAGLLVAGIVTQVFAHAYMVGTLQIIAGIAIGLAGNLTNLAAMRSRRLG